MGFGQQETVVICVSPGLHGKWDVSEKGAEEPLASFNEKEDAYAYATDLTKSKPGAAILVEDEDGFFPLPKRVEGDNATDGTQERNHRGS